MAASVDSAVARYYLERYLTGARVPSPLDSALAAAIANADLAPVEPGPLQELSSATSLDVATLYFIHRVTSEPETGCFHWLYREHLTQVLDSAWDVPGDLLGSLVVFVPGYAYRRDTTTGADFAQQRRLLESLGVSSRLIPVNELGSVEENAEIIATELRRLRTDGRSVILVSASKGSPEAALALGRLLTATESQHVAAWISIGGLLRGSPYADQFASGPKNWLAALLLRIQRLNPATIRDVSRARLVEMTHDLNFREGLLRVAFIGAPLSGQVAPDVRGRFEALMPLGPNDGLTLLADELIPGGMVALEVGLDHFFRDPQLDRKSLALAVAVVEWLAGRRPRHPADCRNQSSASAASRGAP